jgi:[ribosomal protein S5]-alanine N-acetyltransferase
MTVALRTSRLIVRLAMQEDIPEVLRYLTDNRDFLAPFEPIQPTGFYTKRYWREQITRSFQQFQHGHALRLFLFEKTQPKRIIGTANFTNFIYHPFYCCSLGYGLSHDRVGQGFMQEALDAGIRYVFAEMRCHRIQANYMPRNQRSGNVLRRLGFAIEGEAKQYLLINGLWEDHVLTSLTNPQWRLN